MKSDTPQSPLAGDELHGILIDYRINVEKMKPAEAYIEAKAQLNAHILAEVLKLIGEDERFTMTSEDDDYDRADWEREVMQIENRLKAELRAAAQARFGGKQS